MSDVGRLDPIDWIWWCAPCVRKDGKACGSASFYWLIVLIGSRVLMNISDIAMEVFCDGVERANKA
jgi:hypothetical protein